jgi:transcription-repair coupling factor (superfamily II helicase)
VNPATLIRFVQQRAKTHRFDGPQKIRFTEKLEKDEERFVAAELLLAALRH